ncbi:PREDICTED: receptor-like protein 2 [Tarenaya hassleriana]|uniref:receptor-like protein 2 n=1 Tax=Tarenaya hassleriana TaxID=28532 RepID=UPI00053C4DC6|nr:PREDICTED: receptor-like protein 2 [Tarenaya hassleriana]
MPNSFFLFLSVFLFASALEACDSVERAALSSFAGDLTTSDSPALNWSESGDCCLWEGVRCDRSRSRVVGLSLPRRGLTGKISPFVGNLTSLSHLNLTGNHLTGDLPGEIFSLNLLRVLDLSDNRFSGALPLNLPFKFIEDLDFSSNNFHGEISDGFFRLTESVVSLNLSNNNFNGSLPSSICNGAASSSVQALDFSGNRFSGKIPLGFGKCSALRVLLAGYNSLTGHIPDEIYNASTLQILGLHVNHLSGTISPRFSQLVNLEHLELRDNSFNGSIPETIGHLSKLKSLLLQSNELEGNLPKSLMNCTDLTSLILRVNSFDGDISSYDFSRFTRLRLLDLGNNFFTGILPPSMYACKSLQAIRACGNFLQGQIAPEILNLDSLTYVSLSNNNLTNITGAISLLSASKNLTALLICGNFFDETLPDDEELMDPEGFKALTSLALCGSNLHGKIPTWLSKAEKLRFLDISDNRFTGSVPGWLGNLRELFYISLSGNLLSGEIPKDFFNLQGLDLGQPPLELPVFLMPYCVISRQYNTLNNIKPSLYLSRNDLTGRIPREIGRLRFLHTVDLSENRLFGNIPDEISYLAKLETLDVSRNNLTGEIPGSLISLSFLSEFNVSDNNLSGPVPAGGQFHTFTRASFGGNPRLCGSILERKCSSERPEMIEDNGNDPFAISGSSEFGLGIMVGTIVGFSVASVIGILFLDNLWKFRFTGKSAQKQKLGGGMKKSRIHCTRY